MKFWVCIIMLVALLAGGCQATQPPRNMDDITRDWRHPYAPLPVPNQVPF